MLDFACPYWAGPYFEFADQHWTWTYWTYIHCTVLQAWDSEYTQNTALHWAASFAAPAMVALLLEARVSVTAVNTDGVTALHDAVTRGDADIVTLLLAAGADTAAVATRGKLKGKSPRDLAADSEQLRHLFPEPDPASPPTVTMNGDHHQNGDGDSAADSEDTDPAPAPAVKTRPAAAPAPQQLT